jgi:hypothetical protein
MYVWNKTGSQIVFPVTCQMIPDEENNNHCLAFLEFFTQVADYSVCKFGGNQEEFGDVLNQCGGGTFVSEFRKDQAEDLQKGDMPLHLHVFLSGKLLALSDGLVNYHAAICNYPNIRRCNYRKRVLCDHHVCVRMLLYVLEYISLSSTVFGCCADCTEYCTISIAGARR